MSVSVSRYRWSTGEDADLAALVEEIANRLQAGEPVDVEAYLQDRPAQADQLREILPALQGLAELGRSAAAGEASVPPSGSEVGLDRQTLGDFRIVREIGRGGMGVVFEAEQLSLGRRVAVKVLPFAAALDARQLQRFKNEAQAAARLHHTHIVPVHAVGCERGMHFYAMQFIEGHTLAAVIDALRRMRAKARGAPIADRGSGIAEARPAQEEAATTVAALSRTETQRGDPRSSVPDPHSAAFFRVAAQLGVQAAEALDYAHRQEVIHRDIKPANLMVDGRGNLWVTDFGLALFPNDLGLTMTGELLGTLRYMSPEQALAQRTLVDHRTDIYSLGATLYELLTLEPAVPGADRREVLHRIEWDEPRRPRRWNRAVPPELEIIVGKAMAKNPAERYATAQELADDLRRFLEDKPIRARRPTLAQRTAKWARRHRGIVVTAAVATVVGLVLGLVGLFISNRRITWEKAQAVADRQRADRNLTLAMQALERVYLRVEGEGAARDSRRDQADRQLLGLALDFYQRLARENEADPRALQEVAHAYLRLGDIQIVLGQHGQARQAIEKSLELHARLAAERPADYEVCARLAAGQYDLGLLCEQTGDRPASAAHYRQAVEQWARLVSEFPANPEPRDMLASSHIGLGSLAVETRAWAEAERRFRLALNLEEQLTAGFPADVRYRYGVAAGHGNLGNLMRMTEKPAEAEAHYRRSVDLLARLAADCPQESRYGRAHAAACRNLAAVLEDRDRKAAKDYYEQALDVQTRLAAASPTIPEFRHQRADTLNQLGTFLGADGETWAAVERFRQARDIEAKLVDEFPGVPGYRWLLAAVHRNLGWYTRAFGHRTAWKADYRRALDLLTRLVAEAPNLPRYREDLSLAHLDLAKSLESDSDGQGAEAHYGEAREIQARLVAEFPAVFIYQVHLAESHQRLGLLRHARGDQAGAAEHFRQAVALWAEVGAESWKGDGGPKNRRMALDALARLLATHPDPRARDPRRAVELARKAVEGEPTNPSYWVTLGMARYRAGAVPEALAALGRARQIRPSSDPAEGFFRAMIHQHLGNPDKARQEFDDAVRVMEAHEETRALHRRLRSEAAAALGIASVPVEKAVNP